MSHGHGRGLPDDDAHSSQRRRRRQRLEEAFPDADADAAGGASARRRREEDTRGRVTEDGHGGRADGHGRRRLKLQEAFPDMKREADAGSREQRGRDEVDPRTSSQGCDDDARSEKRRFAEEQHDAEDDPEALSRSRVASRSRKRKRSRSERRGKLRKRGLSFFDMKETPVGIIQSASYGSSEEGSAAAMRTLALMDAGQTPAVAQSSDVMMAGRPGRAGGCVRYLTGKCQDPNCPKFHPASEAHIKECLMFFRETYCKWGAVCRTPGCLYKHPDPGQMPLGAPSGTGVITGWQAPCKYGSQCRTMNCAFQHPPHWSTAGLLPVKVPVPPVLALEDTRPAPTPRSELPVVRGMPRLMMPARI